MDGTYFDATWTPGASAFPPPSFSSAAMMRSPTKSTVRGQRDVVLDVYGEEPSASPPPPPHSHSQNANGHVSPPRHLAVDLENSGSMQAPVVIKSMQHENSLPAAVADNAIEKEKSVFEKIMSYLAGDPKTFEELDEEDEIVSWEWSDEERPEVLDEIEDNAGDEEDDEYDGEDEEHEALVQVEPYVFIGMTSDGAAYSLIAAADYDEEEYYWQDDEFTISDSEQQQHDEERQLLLPPKDSVVIELDEVAEERNEREEEIKQLFKPTGVVFVRKTSHLAHFSHLVQTRRKNNAPRDQSKLQYDDLFFDVSNLTRTKDSNKQQGGGGGKYERMSEDMYWSYKQMQQSTTNVRMILKSALNAIKEQQYTLAESNIEDVMAQLASLFPENDTQKGDDDDDDNEEKRDDNAALLDSQT